MDRRTFLGAGASVVGATLLPSERLAASGVASTQDGPANDALGQFASVYMRAMAAPGMTVGLFSDKGVSTRVFGWSDREAKIPVSASQPFWIGSICKSFVGLLCMQLRDEGKLDLHKPILEMMPDLPIVNDFGPITIHHLLTHTSGLPNWLGLFSGDPTQKARQQYAPGDKFAYCNLAFDTLGYLIAHLDGRSWPEAVKERIFKPLGMAGASSEMDDAVQARMPVGYHFQYRDRPCPVGDPLVSVGYVTMSNAAGSIAATPDDMGRYMQMLVQHGRGPSGRVVSAEGFELFSKPYIAAPVLSAGASYGYGIGVETIDGRKMLRHTGGATAFASSILVDLDGGVGAFASINAMQGYRPNPVTKYGVDLLYASKSGQSAPAAPAVADPAAVRTPANFVGLYAGVTGEPVTVAVQGTRLTITTPRGTTGLRALGGDLFSAADGKVMDGPAAEDGPSVFPVQFERDGSKAVNGFRYGSRTYTAASHAPAAASTLTANVARYEGMYVTDSPWGGAVRVIQRSGKLWIGGVEEMHPQGDDSFTVQGGEGTMELKFLAFLGGRPQVLRMDGTVLFRVARIGSGA
jgi:CubicO group peptidase (beta-lactamase class C family)